MKTENPLKAARTHVLTASLHAGAFALDRARECERNRLVLVKLCVWMELILGRPAAEDTVSYQRD